MSDTERERKERRIGVFDRAAPTYDRVGPRFFSHFGRRLVELAQIPSGAAVLDVAAGRGAVLFPAAEQVGPQGRVVGIDLSTGMVRETAAEIKSRGLTNAEMHLMDAEELTFPDASFDFVLCNLAVFFFSRLQCALDEFYRVLRPGGRVGITTFAEDSGFESWFHEMIQPYLPPRDPQDDEDQAAPSPNLETPEGLETVLRNSGFEEIRLTDKEAGFVYEDKEALWASFWSHGARGALEQMGSSTRDRFKSDVFQSIQAFKKADGIHIPPFHVLFALGDKEPHRQQ